MYYHEFFTKMQQYIDIKRIKIAGLDAILHWASLYPNSSLLISNYFRVRP